MRVCSLCEERKVPCTWLRRCDWRAAALYVAAALLPKVFDNSELPHEVGFPGDFPMYRG
jgi:hypothetical protein